MPDVLHLIRASNRFKCQTAASPLFTACRAGSGLVLFLDHTGLKGEKWFLCCVCTAGFRLVSSSRCLCSRPCNKRNQNQRFLLGLVRSKYTELSITPLNTILFKHSKKESLTAIYIKTQNIESVCMDNKQTKQEPLGAA